ncbi:MAG: insulinase family protein [Verrucomicrobia bacterium]|nr:insulinase family protein [Verrucomicrobiota bacterium]
MIHSISLPPHQPRVISLANGFQALLKPDPAATVVSLQVWVGTGSIHEDEWQGAGLSHLLEHMLFNGTERRGPRQVAEDVQAAGASINAYTTFDRTVYYIDTPPESTADCLDILADMILHSTLPEEEFRKEIDVIHREMAMGEDSPERTVMKLLFSTAFQKHPCRHPVIGYRDVFDQITHADLIAFYRHHYVPENMFLVAAGPFDEEDLALRVESLFGAAPRGRRRPVILPLEPRQQGQRVVFREGSTQQTHLRLVWHAPQVTDPNAGAIDLVASILGSGVSSRLYQKLREEQHLVQKIGSFFYAMGDLGLFIVSAEVDPDKVEAARDGILEEVARLCEEGVTEAERSKALNSALSESLSSLTTSEGIASDIGSSWLHTRNPDFTKVHLKGLQETTVEHLRHVARTFLHPDQVSIVALVPKTDRNGPFIHVPAATARETEKRTLSNGLTLLLKKDDRLPLVSVCTYSRGGCLAEPVDVPGVTCLFSRLLTKDTTKLSATRVTERIESAGGIFYPVAGGNTFGVQAAVMAPDWDLALETVADSLTIPAFLDSVLMKEKEAQIASIRSDLDSPMTIASSLMRKVLFAGHPYQFPRSGTEEGVKAVTRDHLLGLHRTCVSAANTVLSVYGDIDPEAVADRAEALFAPLPLGERLFASLAPAPRISETVRYEQSYAKEQAVVLFAFPTGGLHDPDALALDLLSDACSDMSSRFFNRIREDLGAAYAVGASTLLGAAGGCFFFYALTSAELSGKVEDALRGEIDFLAHNGLEAPELARAKRSWQGGNQNRLQSIASQASIHCLDEIQGFGWNHSHLTPAQMDALDAGQLRDIAQRHFLDRPHGVIRLLPEAQPS